MITLTVKKYNLIFKFNNAIFQNQTNCYFLSPLSFTQNGAILLLKYHINTKMILSIKVRSREREKKSYVNTQYNLNLLASACLSPSPLPVLLSYCNQTRTKIGFSKKGSQKDHNTFSEFSYIE